MFAAFAEFERELIRERTREGLKAAKRRGKHMGRKAAVDPEQLDMARRMIEKENKGKAAVARGMGIDPSTLRRAPKRG